MQTLKLSEKIAAMKTKTSHFLKGRLSIQQRLPLLICLLLLVSVVVYGFANYYSLRKATLIIADDRLGTISNELNIALSQSAQGIAASLGVAASQRSVIDCLKSGGKGFHNEVVSILDNQHHDSTYVWTELLDDHQVPVLHSNKSTLQISISAKDALSSVKVAPGLPVAGKIYSTNGSVYVPIIAAVADKQQIIGYIILWKLFVSTPKAVAQFSKLVGIGTDFYIGNTDGSLWTDLIKPIPNIPFKINNVSELIKYTRSDGTPMIAKAQLISNTKWFIVVAFSQQSVLSEVDSFVNWLVLIGVVIIAGGILAAWLMSRTIIKPLNQLIITANAISEGNYSTTIPIDMYQNDEVGQLANAFNIMIGQVSRSHYELESKVEERTAQLANVNKELEAFSYSVSHDLRTPLRAINGYSIMLKEDYDAELDSEGKRIVRNIISNAKMMGQLIDDLLSFSRMGKKDLVRAKIDMQELTETVVRELLQHEPAPDKYQINVGPLPPISADQVMIKQALINLVGNAIKYSSKKEEPVIEIGAREEQKKTIYYIKDNGAGFDMAYSGKLFGVFQRLHSQEEFEGTGVGLALAKRIIEKHKGEIWAEGKENAGATFYFSLPKI